MNIVRLNKFQTIMLIFFAAGVFGFYTASILTMQHEENNMVNCPVGVSHGMETQNPDFCVTYHLGLMHNLSESSPLRINFQILALLLASLILFVAISLVSLLENFYSRLKVRCRWLFEKTLEIFFAQLGFWLILFEKRDPSYASVLA